MRANLSKILILLVFAFGKVFAQGPVCEEVLSHAGYQTYFELLRKTVKTPEFGQKLGKVISKLIGEEVTKIYIPEGIEISHSQTDSAVPMEDVIENADSGSIVWEDTDPDQLFPVPTVIAKTKNRYISVDSMKVTGKRNCESNFCYHGRILISVHIRNKKVNFEFEVADKT